jgi:hypothetical protein
MSRRSQSVRGPGHCQADPRLRRENVYEAEAPVFHSHHYGSAQLFMRYFDLGYTFEQLKIWDAPGTCSSRLRDFRKMLRKQVDRGNNGGTPDQLSTSVGPAL